MNKRTGQKRVGVLATSATCLAAALTGVGLSAPEPANAYVCGYNEQIEAFSSDWEINLPFFGSVDPFGGERVVGHYGNCGDSNVKISGTTASGTTNKCVEPGDTRLGFTGQAPEVSGAIKVGSC